MQNAVLGTRSLQKHRFHQTAARFKPIARVCVEMSAPEAVRAMVGVAIAYDKRPAMLA